MNTPKARTMGCGTQTAALNFGGSQDPSPTVDLNNTESYNGTSWTAVNTLNTARQRLSGAGTQTSSLAFGGSPNNLATESWNGTSWTNQSDLISGKSNAAGAGSSNTSALVFGGSPVPTSTSTQEWNGPSLATKTITTS